MNYASENCMVFAFVPTSFLTVLLLLEFQTVIHRIGVNVQENIFDILVVREFQCRYSRMHIFFEVFLLIGCVAVGETLRGGQDVVGYKVGFEQLVVAIELAIMLLNL